MHPWNRAYGAILPLKKELYMPEDIIRIQDATNILLLQFSREGILITSGLNVVRSIRIDYESISEQVRYVDMETVRIRLLT